MRTNVTETAIELNRKNNLENHKRRGIAAFEEWLKGCRALISDVSFLDRVIHDENVIRQYYELATHHKKTGDALYLKIKELGRWPNLKEFEAICQGKRLATRQLWQECHAEALAIMNGIRQGEHYEPDFNLADFVSEQAVRVIGRRGGMHQMGYSMREDRLDEQTKALASAIQAEKIEPQINRERPHYSLKQSEFTVSDDVLGCLSDRPQVRREKPDGHTVPVNFKARFYQTIGQLEKAELAFREVLERAEQFPKAYEVRHV